jgi:hypothetical protein
MVRRRKLRTEYTWIWLLAAAVIFILLIRYDWLIYLSSLMGIVVVTSTVFLLAILFLLVVNLGYAAHLSALNDQVKNLAQAVALLEERQSSLEPLLRQLKESSEDEKQNVEEGRIAGNQANWGLTDGMTDGEE